MGNEVVAVDHHLSDGPLPRRLERIERALQLLLAERGLTRAASVSERLHPLLSLITAGDGASATHATGLAVIGGRLLVATQAAEAHSLRLVQQLGIGSNAYAWAEAPARLVVLVQGLPRRADDDRSRRSALRITQQLLQQLPDVAVGISCTLGSAAHAATAHAEALDAAAVAARTSRRYVLADEDWAQLASSRLAAAVRAALPRENPLDRLARYDEENAMELFRTLSVWLSHSCDTPGTARELGLHPNSVRYRLKRLQAVSGLDLEDSQALALAKLLVG